MSPLLAFSEEIQRKNNKLIVHATRLEAAKAALELGAKLLVHSVTDQVIDDAFIDLMKSNESILSPTLVVSEGYLKTRKAILGEKMTIEDPNDVMDRKTRNLIENIESFIAYVDQDDLRMRVERMEQFVIREDSIMLANLKKLYDAGVLIAVGTDAGNPGTFPGISIFDEMEKMQSAGIDPNDLDSGKIKWSELQNLIPKDHIYWMKALPNYYIDGDYLFVHAGVFPGIPLQQQKPEWLLWIRDRFLNSNLDHGYRVIHGHCPTEGHVDIRKNRINMDTGAVWRGVQYAIAIHDEQERFIKTPMFSMLSDEEQRA